MSCPSCTACPHAAACRTVIPKLNRPYRIALVGNPNCGKTSLYNALTGEFERVGNFPGITVTLKTGNLELCGIDHELVDLPGVYSLSAFARDEMVTRDFLWEYPPDLVINVLDAANLERNLYLTAELSEMEIPTVVVLNMMDVAERIGFEIDVHQMSEWLGVPVIPVVASKKRGIEPLKSACVEVLAHPACLRHYDPPHELGEDFASLEQLLVRVKDSLPVSSVRRCASQLVEGDRRMLSAFETLANPLSTEIKAQLKVLLKRLSAHSGESGDVAVTEARYAYAGGLVRRCVKYHDPGKRQITERLDDWICHRYLGIFIMVGAVYLLFATVFALSDDWNWIPWGFSGEWFSPQGIVEHVFGLLASVTDHWVTVPWVHSLLTQGVISGIGSVMSFVPMLFMMFIFIAVLEDSGYIARVSFILDRVLRIFGLQGKSVLSLVMAGGLGPGCAVPAIMATRTLRDEKDRIITMMVAPMMTCGAKLPVLMMLVGAFFAGHKQGVMLLLWLISWACALIAAVILSKWVIKGESTPFVMELPVYHLPRPKGVLMHACNNTWLYIRKAWTIILLVNVGIWVLMYFPVGESSTAAQTHATPKMSVDSARTMIPVSHDSRALTDSVRHALSPLANSYAGKIGRALTPVTQFCGFDWRDNIALLGGAAAKEVVLSTLATAYGMDDSGENASFENHLANDPWWTPLRAFALILFVMIYSPCAATLAVIWSETRSLKWVIFVSLFSTGFAYLLSAAVYQGGRILGL